jgi:hypothetical protein
MPDEDQLICLAVACVLLSSVSCDDDDGSATAALTLTDPLLTPKDVAGCSTVDEIKRRWRPRAKHDRGITSKDDRRT